MTKRLHFDKFDKTLISIEHCRLCYSLHTEMPRIIARERTKTNNKRQSQIDNEPATDDIFFTHTCTFRHAFGNQSFAIFLSDGPKGVGYQIFCEYKNANNLRADQCRC